MRQIALTLRHTKHHRGRKYIAHTARPTQNLCGVPYAAKNRPKKCAAYPTPRRTDRKSVRRTLRREELTEKVCGVPYAAKNWPKKCAAYPTPHRTDRKSVRRTLRRIELTKIVCGVPYAAKNWPKKCAAYPTPHRTDQKSVRRTLRRTLFLHISSSLSLHPGFFSPCSGRRAHCPWATLARFTV